MHAIAAFEPFHAVPHLHGMQVPTAGVFTPQALQSCVRANFAANKAAPPQQQGALLDKVHSDMWQANAYIWIEMKKLHASQA